MKIIYEEKFSTTTIALLIVTKADRKTVTLNSLISRLLGSKSPSETARRLDEAGGGTLHSGIIKKGEFQIIELFMEIPHDSISEGAELLTALIKHPDLSGKAVEREKKNLSDYLNSIETNKREYALTRATEISLSPNPAGLCFDGYKEDLSKIDSDKIIAHYKSIIENQPILIMSIGKAKEEDFKALSELCRADLNKHLSPEITPKDERLSESFACSQGELVISLTFPPASDYCTLLLLNEILGGGGSSVLFSTIREKHKLCYSISSTLYRFTNHIFIQSGLNDPKKATELILKAVKDLGSTDISEQIRTAKRSVSERLIVTLDSASALLDFHLTKTLLSDNSDIPALCKKIESITEEEIKALAKSAELNTIFYLKPKEDKNADN